jgi:acyl-coenzyme A thioesterase PaaI-like protein
MAHNISRSWFPKFSPLVQGKYVRAFSHHTPEHSSKQTIIDRHSGGKFVQDDMTSKVQAHEISAFVKKEWPDFPEVQCHEISARHVVVSKDVPESGIRPGGFISGPTQFAMVDLGMWYAVFGAVGFEAMALTSECSIRFTRPALGRKLWARVDINSISGRNIAMTTTVWTDNVNKPTSIAQGTYVVPRKK